MLPLLYLSIIKFYKTLHIDSYSIEHEHEQPHVPPSWSQAGSGLTHVLDEYLIRREIMILHRTLSGLNSSRARRNLGDDLSAIKSICVKVDVRGDFANLHRVQCGDSSLWTNLDGIKLIREACDDYDFKQAMKIQTTLETKLKSQEQLIKELQEKIELMTWHKEMNLNVPQTHSTKNQLSTRNDSLMIDLSSTSTTQAEKSARKAIKETISYIPSTTTEGSPLKTDDVDDITTFRDQISVD